MRRRAKSDGNQAELVKQLRRIPNLSVAVTSRMGQGYPDIVVGFQGVNFMMEIKDPAQQPSRRKLTNDEEHFQRNWRGQYAVVSTIEDCIRVITNGIDFKYVDRFNVWTSSIWKIDASGFRKQKEGV